MINKKTYLIITPYFPSEFSHVGSYVYDQAKAIKDTGHFVVKVIKIVSLFSKEKDYKFNDISVEVFRTIDFPFFILPGLFNWFNSIAQANTGIPMLNLRGFTKVAGGVSSLYPNENSLWIGSASLYGKGFIADFSTDTTHGVNIGIRKMKPTTALEVSGSVSSSGATIHNVHTFTDGDTTPSVANGTMFKTANTSNTVIEGLDDGVTGQVVHILIQDTNTDFEDGTNFNLFRSLDWTSATTNDVLSMICVDGTKWTSLARQDNS